ncbi:hypothetical protein M3572_01770 [Lederbergia lenta]|nr:DUF6886 family protein [Lederbergia lenta]MCM3109611.1 hypothetical protein [Lederbergia lenta]
MLYHFSEDPSIAIFKPRPSKAFPELSPVVWAIDKEHSAHYYVPRDCPREKQNGRMRKMKIDSFLFQMQTKL